MAEDVVQCVGALADDEARGGRIIFAQAARDAAAPGRDDLDDITAREIAFHRGRACRQQAVARTQCLRRALVDADRAARGEAARDPRLARARMAFADRSEEHTSELQSLMRISYAVFCLKKKNTYKQAYT